MQKKQEASARRKKYAKIFFTCFYISSFTFGGGFVIISLMREKFVHNLKWLEEQEMLDLTAIAQASPGSIAVNTSIMLGYKVGGFIGALVALAGTVLPPLIILSVISLLYTFIKGNKIVSAIFAGMRAAVAALIVDVLITMSAGVAKEKNWLNLAIMVISFVLIFFVKVNVMYIVLAAVLIGVILAIYHKKRGLPILEKENTTQGEEDILL